MCPFRPYMCPEKVSLLVSLYVPLYVLRKFLSVRRRRRTRKHIYIYTCIYAWAQYVYVCKYVCIIYMYICMFMYMSMYVCVYYIHVYFVLFFNNTCVSCIQLDLLPPTAPPSLVPICIFLFFYFPFFLYIPRTGAANCASLPCSL